MNEPAASTETDRESVGPGGSKGGVSESMMTIAILDYLIENGESVVLVECDTSNRTHGSLRLSASLSGDGTSNSLSGAGRRCLRYRGMENALTGDRRNAS